MVLFTVHTDTDGHRPDTDDDDDVLMYVWYYLRYTDTDDNDVLIFLSSRKYCNKYVQYTEHFTIVTILVVGMYGTIYVTHRHRR